MKIRALYAQRDDGDYDFVMAHVLWNDGISTWLDDCARKLRQQGDVIVMHDEDSISDFPDVLTPPPFPGGE